MAIMTVFLIFQFWFQNDDRKTRTSVFVLVATELADDWEDAKNIGKYGHCHLLPTVKDKNS